MYCRWHQYKANGFYLSTFEFKNVELYFAANHVIIIKKKREGNFLKELQNYHLSKTIKLLIKKSEFQEIQVLITTF
jgi:hypothetical protein